VLVLDRGDGSQVDSAPQASADARLAAPEERRASREQYEANPPPNRASTGATGERRGTDSLGERAISAADSSRAAGDATSAAPPSDAMAAASPSAPEPVATAPAAAAGELGRARDEKASPSRRADSPAEQQVASAVIAELDKEPPARWVDRIQTLRREGRRAEADALLREFTRRYGDAAVLPTLRSHD